MSKFNHPSIRICCRCKTRGNIKLVLFYYRPCSGIGFKDLEQRDATAASRQNRKLANRKDGLARGLWVHQTRPVTRKLCSGCTGRRGSCTAASLANLTPDPPAGTKRNSKRVGTYPRQRPRTAAASSPFPSSLRRDTSRRHRRYDIWVSQHQCRRDILQGWLSRTPLKWNSLVQGYRHTLYSAPLFPPGRGWGPFLAPSLSVPHSRLVRSHGHAPFDKPRLSTSLPSCERASSIRSTLARLLDSPSSDHRLPASFSG